MSPDARYVLAGTQGGGRRERRGAGVAAPREGPSGFCYWVSWWTASSLLVECADQDPFASPTNERVNLRTGDR